MTLHIITHSACQAEKLCSLKRNLLPFRCVVCRSVRPGPFGPHFNLIWRHLIVPQFPSLLPSFLFGVGLYPIAVQLSRGLAL